MTKSLLSCLLLAASLPAAGADLFTPRVFDIVPPEGRNVEMVDGLTVLRQQGTQFGAVLTFAPESGVSAWIPLAVLNTSAGELEVGTHRVSARYGDAELKVWSTTGLIRDAQRRRNDMIAAGGGRHETVRDRVDNAAAPLPQMAPSASVGAGGIGGRPMSSGAARTPSPRPESNEEFRARELADRQVEALKERLFREQDLEPRKLAPGEVRIELPPHREDGQPTEFVLTLAFGGETMDVLFRERDGSSVEVGDVTVPTAAAPEAEPTTE